MKKFKVLLINPSYMDQIHTTTKDVHLAMERKPPLGILSIGTYLKINTDFDVELLDNQLEALQEEELSQKVSDYQPDVVGFTVVSFKLYAAYRLTRIVKESFPSAHVCWGGPHVSIFPEESLHLAGVDSIILGDGELPFTRLCQNLSEGKKTEDIRGVYTPENIPLDKQFRQFVNFDLNTLPYPDLTLLPYRKYRSFLTNNLMATAITSKGCPHRCIFCKLDFMNIRMLSIEKVVEQIGAYVDLGIKEIEFYDETFNLNTKRVIEFASEIIKNGLRFKWSFRGRVNAVSAEMLELIKEAGCQRIQYGVESGTDKVLKILKKGINTDQVKKCFYLTNQVKIDTVAYFILGNPKETWEDIQQSIRLAKEIKPSYLEYAIFNISPGTESYEMALEQGIIDRDYWKEYACNPDINMPVLVWTENFSEKQLIEIRRKALRDFYIRPSYLFNRMIRLKRNEARRVIKTGFTVLKELFQ